MKTRNKVQTAAAVALLLSNPKEPGTQSFPDMVL